MNTECKFCHDPIHNVGNVLYYICQKCDTNFGTMYCSECMPYYYDIKRTICLKCERGIQG